MKELKFKVGDIVTCEGDKDIVIRVLENDPDGYDYELKENGTQSEGCLSSLPL